VEQLQAKLNAGDTILRVEAGPEGRCLHVSGRRPPEDLRSQIETDRGLLTHYLLHGRELDLGEVTERELTVDPRGDDLPDDSPAWCALFRNVIDTLGSESDLLHALRATRECGARIDGGCILPGEELGAEWAVIREEWLDPYDAELEQLMPQSDPALPQVALAGDGGCCSQESGIT
jgi:hypothetical protein